VVKRLPLLVVCSGYFMVILDTTVVNAALPALRDDLGGGVSALQWVVDGYMLTFAALLLSGGALGDRVGARTVFRLGLILFVAASAACGLAPTTGMLVAARVVQGGAAALLVPSSLALLSSAYGDPASRARAVGVWGAISAVAGAAGPVVGGALTGALSWRWVFFVNVPIGLAGLALTERHVPAPAPRPGRGFDPLGQITGIVALASVTMALIEAGRSSWTAPAVFASLAVFVVAASAFVVLERRAPDPLLPLGLFSNSTFAGGTLIGLLINLGFYGEMFVINLMLQEGRGLSPFEAGLALLPQMGLAMIGSMLSGRLTARVGSPRPTLVLGLLIGASGLIGLAVAGIDAAYVVLVLPLFATGFGMALTMPAATSAVVESAPPERTGVAAGVINASRQVGGVIGVALLGTLAANGLAGGLRAGLFVAAGAFLVGALISVVWVERETRSPAAVG
jgi:DHA2 family methylenomycin A resistance protein-like MFS transporter